MALCRKARPISPCCVWGFSEPQEWTLRSQRSTAAAPDSAATHKIDGRQKGSALNHLQYLRQKKRIRHPTRKSSPYRRTRTDQVEGGCFPEEERWPAQTHVHTQTHTYRWLFPYHISYLHRPRAGRMYLMLSGEGAVWKQATGELHKHCNFPKRQAPPALPSYHRVGIDRHGRKHTNKKNVA